MEIVVKIKTFLSSAAVCINDPSAAITSPDFNSIALSLSQCVCVCACTQVVRFLLECNAKLNKKDHYGNTPLIHACLCSHVETASILLEVKIEVCPTHAHNHTHNHARSSLSCVRVRPQSNALVNVANLQGNTALHEAVRRGHQPLVELLLRGGASPGLRNKRQRTPLDCAYELGGKVRRKRDTPASFIHAQKVNQGNNHVKVTQARKFVSMSRTEGERELLTHRLSRSFSHTCKMHSVASEIMNITD